MNKNPLFATARSKISTNEYGKAAELLLPVSKSTNKGARAEAFFLLGCIAGLTGNHVLARERFEKALKLFPENPNIRFNLGKALEDQGLQEQAVKHYKRVLVDDPLNDAARLNLANCLLANRNFNDAKAFYQEILFRNSRNTGALTGLGCCLVELGDVRGGLDLHREALKFDNSLVAAWSNQAIAFKKLGRELECIHSHERAIELSPLNGDLRLNLFSTLTFFGRFQQAQEVVGQISACGLKVNRPIEEMSAEVYRGKGCLTSAQNILEPLVLSNAPAVSSLNLYGMVLRDLGKLVEAKQVFERVLDIDPSNDASKFNLSLVLLESMDFKAGWVAYQSRWGTSNFPSPRFGTSKKLSEGKTSGRLLVCGEQGVGDQLMFLHGLHYARALSPSVLSSIDSRLIPLAKVVAPEVEFLSMDEEIDEDMYDEFVYAGDVFGAWHSRQLDNFKGLCPINIGPFSKASGSSSGRPLIGLSWRSKNRQFGQFKSPDLQFFRCLNDISDSVDWINLQYGWEPDELEQFNQMGLVLETRAGINLLDDFLGLCHLIVECDLVLTVSNSTAHLCGLLGKRAIVITPMQNGRLWYWHSVDSRSYWYPSIEVVRSEDGWGDCFHRVMEIMRDFLSNRTKLIGP